MSLIYQPKGAAGEYARYAVNFYNGCSNGCTYCYNKRGLAKNLLGKDEPTIKAGYDDNWMCMVESFKGEALKMIDELREHGIFMSFTTDPLLHGTSLSTFTATNFLTDNLIHTYILTKGESGKFFLDMVSGWKEEKRKYVHFGVTLTGCDDMEPNALPNATRIGLLCQAKSIGLPTFVSLEPVIDLKKSFNMVKESCSWVDEYRIGLLTPIRSVNYPQSEVMDFIWCVKGNQKKYNYRIMWKESFRKICRKYNIEHMLNN